MSNSILLSDTNIFLQLLLHMQNNNELTLTLATHSAINVLYVNTHHLITTRVN